MPEHRDATLKTRFVGPLPAAEMEVHVATMEMKCRPDKMEEKGDELRAMLEEEK
jgi:hypothetical protein